LANDSDSLHYVQTSNIVDVKNYTMDDGLPSNTVEEGFQDSRGLIWFPTKYGLTYFDGRNFQKLDKKSNGLRILHVYHIAEDAKGRIWVKSNYTSETIDVIDSETLQATPAEELFPSITKLDGSLLYLFSDFNNDIYIVTRKGLLYKKGNGDNFSLIHQSEFVDKLIISRALRIGQKGVWFDYDQITARYMSYDGTVNDVYLGNSFNRPMIIGVDEKDNLIFVVIRETNYGDGVTFRELPENNKIVNQNIYRASPKGSIKLLSQNLMLPTTALKRPNSKYFQDRITGNIFGFDKKMGAILLTQDGNWETLIPQTEFIKYPGIDKSLAFFDNLGNIWLCTRANGIYKINLRENHFTTHFKQEILPIALDELNSVAKGLFVDEQKHLYVNSSTSLYKMPIFDNTKKATVINDWSGLALKNISDKIFVGSRGLIELDKNGKFLNRLNYSYKTENQQAYRMHYHQGDEPNQNFWAVYKSKSGKLWVGLNRGLFYYDDKKNNFIRFTLEPDNPQMVVYQIFASRDSLLWAVTSEGLYQFDENSGNSIQYWNGIESGISNEFNGLYNVYEDSEGIFWLATNGGGLIKWNRKTNTSKIFNIKDGLSSNILFSILEDSYNKLWISSYYGLNSIEKTTEHINTYLTSDGLVDNEFSSISYYKSAIGEMFFGTVNGVISFDPKDFLEAEKEFNVPLRIISFNQFEDAENKLVDKTKELISTNKIILHPGDKFFTLGFSLLSYEDGQNKYAYKFEGLDEDWNYISENSIRISNLDYGNYALKIKGQNQKSKWSTAELSINVEVLTPFYKKAWFKIVLILGLGLIIVSYLRYRIRLHEKERERLEFEVVKRTKKIEHDKKVIEEDKKIIEKQAEELRELDAAKTRLFGNISHELRTPLTLILGPLDAVLKGRYGEIQQKVKSTITRAAKNGNQLLRLIEQILDLSSLDSGKLLVNEKVVELSRIVNEIKNSFEPFAESKNIKWYIEKEFDPSLNIMLDYDKFGKIVYNLLSNAFKFTPDGGEVSLSVKHDKNDRFLFSVKDNGKGIPSEDIPNIFDRFFQSLKMSESNVGGSGIGLAFAKELSIALGGDLKVESEIGIGTRFTLMLPLKNPKEFIDDRKQQSEQLTNTQLELENSSDLIDEHEEQISLEKDHTILVVEDNNDLLEFITEILSNDFKVIRASDGIEAIEKLQVTDNKIDFILSDIMMPRMDGFELLEKVKADEELKKLPVVLLTAKATSESKIKALRVGVDDYMYKPFLPEELLARVKNLLFHYEQRDIDEVGIVETEPEIVETQDLVGHDLQWLEKAERVCRENIKDSRFNVNEFAYQMITSERQLQRTIKKITGLSPAKYMREVKLKIAREIIEKDSCNSLSEVSYEIGFERTDYFIKLYKQRFGIPPQIKTLYN